MNAGWVFGKDAPPMRNAIVFVNPPYDRVAPGYDFVRHIAGNIPSLGLLHLAAQVREDGYHSSIIECEVQGLDVAKTVERESVLTRA